MERIQNKIEVGSDRVPLAWRPRWLLSPTAIGYILTDMDRHNASLKVTVSSAKDKDKLLKNWR